MAEVILTDEAEAEFTEALLWYGNRSEQTAVRFDAAVRAALDLIGQRPEMFARHADGDYRSTSVHGFPYMLVYYLVGEDARVVAVAHTSRRPGYWQGRS